MDETTIGARPPRRGAAGPEAAGVDLERSRRPGVPRLHPPEPLPNARFPVEPQRSDVTVLMHGRRHKTFPPVFGTALPPRGISGIVRRVAYRHPDHAMRHWTLLMLADRIDLWEHRARRVARVAAPALLLAGLAGVVLRAAARR